MASNDLDDAKNQNDAPRSLNRNDFPVHFSAASCRSIQQQQGREMGYCLFFPIIKI